MRIRLSAILILCIAGGLAFVLFKTSQNVQQSERRLREVQLALAKEEDAIRVLETEWDYLNRPDRLEGLVRQHLNMIPSKPAALVRDGADLPRMTLPVPPRKPVTQARSIVHNVPEISDPAPVSRANPAPQDSGRRFDDLLSDLTRRAE
jgi:hypothetical protein